MNNQFTWIPIYKEIAEKLLNYENKQNELIDIVKSLQNKNFKTISLNV